MTDPVEHEKRALRAEFRERRQLLSEAQRDAAAAGIAQQLDALVAEQGATSIACYLSSPTEPGTRGFLAAALEHGLRVLLPVTREDGLLDWAVASPDGGEVVGALGVPEPVGEVLGSIAVNDVDLMIIPAAAIDVGGGAWGGGAATTTRRSARWRTGRPSTR